MKNAVFYYILIMFFTMFSSCDKGLSFNSVAEKEQKIAVQESDKIVKLVHKYDNSRQYTKKAIAQAEELRKKGYKLYKQKKDKQALVYYKQSIDLYPTAETYYNYGNSLMNVHKFDKAVIAYKCALTYRPKHRYYNYNLACAYSLNGHKELALQYLERALDIGYNHFLHIWKDPDLAFLRKFHEFDTLLEKYSSRAISKSLVIKERYTEIDQGMSVDRYIFHRDGTYSTKSIGKGPYSEMYSDEEEDAGTWKVRSNRVYITSYDNKTQIIYLKLGTHEGTY